MPHSRIRESRQNNVPPTALATSGRPEIAGPPDAPSSPTLASTPRGPLLILLALSWLLPLLVLAMAGWWTWQVELRTAKNRVSQTLTILDEYIHDVFNTNTLVLDWMNDRVAGMSWSDIEHSRPLFRLMSLIDRDHPQFSDMFMVDATGRMRINDHSFPQKKVIQLGDTDYFRALAGGTTSLFISAPSRVYPTRVLSFCVARLRRTADGRFDGLIAVAVDVDSFLRFFHSVIGSTKNAITLSRQDGVVLARYPAAPPNTPIGPEPPRPSPPTTQIGTIGPYVSPLDGRKRLVGVRAIAGYPVVLSYGIDYASIFDAWLTSFVLYSGVALASALVLSAVTFMALRGELRERRAVNAWKNEQSHRLAAEANARRMEKYEALGTLAGGIAHHFNNLLPALTGHLEIAIEEGGTASRAAPRLRRMLQEIANARKIIRNILLFSRRDITAFRGVDLSEAARRSIEMFRPIVSDHAELRAEIAPGIKILGDAPQLSELVTNLLSNAYDALEGAGGRITLGVDTALSTVKAGSLEVGSPCARILCSDTGSGMPPETFERAFDPFFTTKKAGSGAGLGLAICDGIVRNHGGRILVDSESGVGTVFTIFLPLAPAGTS